jgi:hypothetical protein
VLCYSLRAVMMIIHLVAGKKGTARRTNKLTVKAKALVVNTANILFFFIPLASEYTL